MIRRQGDKGLFVILSSAMPSRLLTAFPPEVSVSRVPLDIALARVSKRLFGERGGEPVAQRDEAGEVDSTSLFGGDGSVDI